MKKISMMMMVLLAAMTMSANKFAKVKTAPTDWSGQYLLACHTDSVEYIFNGDDANNGYTKAVAKGDTIVSDVLDGFVVELASMSGGYSVKWVASGKYMSGTNGSNSVMLGTDPVLNTITFNKVDSIDLISNTSMFTFNSTKGTMRFRYYKPKTVSDNKKTYCHLSLYKAQTEIKPEEWTPDTISVSEARALIATSDPKKSKSHYVKGVVASTNFGQNWPGWAMIWMTDIDNPTDSLEGYKIYKDANSTKWASAEEIPCGLNDTVMLFADGLSKYGSTYETTSGYFVETLGKSSAINANDIFKYAVGARQWGLAYDSVRYKYELVISRDNAEGYENALHMMINSANELGIAGKYTLISYMTDSSHVDGEGGVAGTVELAYVEDAGIYNKYTVKADFTVGGQLYHMDTTFNLAGYDFDYSEQFKLSDDVPFIPEDGDTITCAQAVSYAKTLGSATSTMTVWVRGYATGFQTILGRTQQSVYMADDASATKGIFMGYLCYTQGLDSIIKGDEILVKGNISYYSASSTAQISKGNIYRIGGSDTKRARDIQCVEVPAGAITVAEAIQIGNALQATVGQTVSTDTEYTVYGYIVDVNRQTSKDSATWYMHDVKGEYGDFKAYKCHIPNLIDEDDMVFVTGKISKYQKSAEVANIEIAQGSANFACDHTGLEQVKAVAEKNGAHKVMKNGQLFILKDNQLYNALGVPVQ